jgi:hypothetical protein
VDDDDEVMLCFKSLAFYLTLCFICSIWGLESGDVLLCFGISSCIYFFGNFLPFSVVLC